MSLKNKFKVDTKLVSDGVWHDFKDAPNSDGTIPGFRLARICRQNRDYQKALRNVGKRFADAEGDIDANNVDEELLDKAMVEVFLSTVLLEWRNFQPEDDGVFLQYTKKNAEIIFGSSEWADLYEKLESLAKKASAYRQKKIEAEAKN